MTTPKTGFLLGLGSNIDPFANFARIIDLLLNSFEQISISRILNIPPVGMNSQHDFLNAVAFIATDLSAQQLKTICNQIEIELGRDRTDPDRKHKDRPADLDILATTDLPEDAHKPASSITDEYFLYPLIDELHAYLLDSPTPALQAGSNIQVGQLTFGQTATTIYRNRDTGKEGIL